MKIIKALLSFFAVLVLLSSSSTTYALSVIQRKVIDSGSLYFNVEDAPILSVCGSPTTLTTNRSIYMIGDSITNGSTSQLESTFNAGGYTSFIDGVDSRALTSGTTATDGLSVLNSSGSSFANAASIVIALGTNGGITQASVDEVMRIVRQFTQSASQAPTIYWVNIGVNNDLRSGADLPAGDWNSLLQQESLTQVFSVIDWASVVEGDPSLIADDGLGVHPTAAGRTVFANTVFDGIQNNNPLNTSCGDTVCDTDGPESNKQKVWNCMISKGLEPFQVAGFMGNMQAEAAFEPRRVEYPSSSDVWRDGRYPDSLSDTVPPCLGSSCRPGYGIVQWTAEGRKDNLRAFSEENGIIAGDLGLQIDFVWVEITEENGCCPLKRAFRDRFGDVSILVALQQTTTIEEATDLILRNYEIPAHIDTAYQTRIGFARSILIEFDSGGAPPSGPN